MSFALPPPMKTIDVDDLSVVSREGEGKNQDDETGTGDDGGNQVDQVDRADQEVDQADQADHGRGDQGGQGDRDNWEQEAVTPTGASGDANDRPTGDSSDSDTDNEGSYDSNDSDSSDDSDEDSDYSDEDSDDSGSVTSDDSGGSAGSRKSRHETTPRQKKENATERFDYEDVIDDTSNTPSKNQVHDEDIGGEVVATASIVGASAVSSFRGKRSLIIYIVVMLVVACILYYMWTKIHDLKKKILQLEQQQEMSLNDRDVQAISSQVIEDYLREEDEAEDTSESGTTTSADNRVLDTIDEVSEENDEPVEDDSLLELPARPKRDDDDESSAGGADDPATASDTGEKEHAPNKDEPVNEPVAESDNGNVTTGEIHAGTDDALIGDEVPATADTGEKEHTNNVDALACEAATISNVSCEVDGAEPVAGEIGEVDDMQDSHQAPRRRSRRAHK